LPDGVSFEQGVCLGILGITAHRCVHAADPVEGRTVLIQGGAGAVGLCAVQLARRGGASVIATVGSSGDISAVSKAGVHHIVEVAFGTKIAIDLELLSVHGSVATYATDTAAPPIPFWPFLFKNISEVLVFSPPETVLGHGSVPPRAVIIDIGGRNGLAFGGP
jgi:NADPH:quinone reductase